MVDNLVQLTELYGSRLQCFEYYGGGQGILHAKLFIAHSDGKVQRFLTGSSNMTENAFKHNEEHGVRIDYAGNEDLSNKVIKYFDALWENDHCTAPLSKDRAETYRKNYRRNERFRKKMKELDAPPRTDGQVRHWIFKANVYVDTFTDLYNRENRTDMWNGIRQAQARNYIRDEMKTGDRLLFYHTGGEKPKKLDDCEIELPTGTVQKAVVGTAIVVSEAIPDCTAWDENSRLFYDPNDDPEDPKWFMVDIQAEQKLHPPVRLEDIRKEPQLQGFCDRIFDRQPRVPIHRVSAGEFQAILEMRTRVVTP